MNQAPPMYDTRLSACVKLKCLRCTLLDLCCCEPHHDLKSDRLAKDTTIQRAHRRLRAGAVCARNALSHAR